nr:hypothetical protein [Tanacetum cinerariifolium]
MEQDAFWLDAHDHARLFVHSWRPLGNARAVVLPAWPRPDRHARDSGSLRRQGWLEQGGRRPRHPQSIRCGAASGRTGVPVGPQHGQLHRPGVSVAPQRQLAGRHSQRLELPAGDVLPIGGAGGADRALAPGTYRAQRGDRALVIRRFQ